MKILLWHVHGSWTTSFVQGDHTYYVPLVPDRGPDGRGRAQTWQWPPNVIEVDEDQAQALDFDAVIFQRPHEFGALGRRFLGAREPGVDFAGIYLEHDTPSGEVASMRHVAADRDDLVLVHVTPFNELFWDAGTTRTHVIEHAIVDPGYRYSGEIAHSAVVINEAARRGRVTGTDLLPRFAEAAPIDLFGMDAARFGGFENLPQAELHRELPRRRVYLHPVRWTSLGLSLIEAMYLGMPVVALATTDAVRAVPAEAGAISTSVPELVGALRALHADPERARQSGACARAFACERYGLARFLGAWDALLDEVTR